jgi:hypothetical protein
VSARVEWAGLAELRIALGELPNNLTTEGAEEVRTTVETTARRLVLSYPKGETGNLRAGVRTTFEPRPSGAFGMVRNIAPHAHLYEFGTQSRRTRKGWSRGVAPSHKPMGLVPIAQQQRRTLNRRVIDLVRHTGLFELSGSF